MTPKKKAFVLTAVLLSIAFMANMIDTYADLGRVPLFKTGLTYGVIPLIFIGIISAAIFGVSYFAFKVMEWL